VSRSRAGKGTAVVAGRIDASVSVAIVTAAIAIFHSATSAASRAVVAGRIDASVSVAIVTAAIAIFHSATSAASRAVAVGVATVDNAVALPSTSDSQETTSSPK
jgi:hypothetical protein